MKKKVLIVLADVGNGHRSAANALEKIFKTKYPDQYSVKSIDLFVESDIEPYNSSQASYSLVSQNRTLERINNFFFRLSNSELVFDLFAAYTSSRLLEECEKIINKESPDIIISVHPIISIVIKRMKIKNPNAFKSVTIITDLVTLLRGWADSSADLVFSPTSDAVNTLVKDEVDVSKIVYPLFPINPDLQNVTPKDKILEELEFNAEKPIILLTGGGVGTKMFKKAISKLVLEDKYQLIIISGRLESFKSELENQYNGNSNVKVLGFVNNIQDYYNVADVVIAKPGPATILELELFNKKVILTKRIGEQEVGNVTYALRNPKFRYIGEDWSKLEATLSELVDANPREGINIPKRSFDECEKIVDEIVKLD